MQIAGGYADPHISLMPRLRQILKGVEVTRARQGSIIRPRLPITPNILRRIKRVWASPTHGHKLLWAACLIAFFGFCRSGEITIPQKGAYDPKVHLSFRDVAVDQASRPRVVSLLLRRSKTDQSGRGVKIILGRTDHDLCPVGALMEYLMVRGSGAGPLLQWSNGDPLTKTSLVTEVRQALHSAGLPAKDYAGHSFRIGAATSAAAAGVEDSTIQALGRWRSSAYLRYIRACPRQLANVARSLSSCDI